MRLSDKEIFEALKTNWLTISPAPDASKISGVSLDIHLGCEFRCFRPSSAAYLDLAEAQAGRSEVLDAMVSEPIRLKANERFFLQPQRLALGVSLERFKIPDNLVGWLDGRSSLARLGLMVHMTAHRLDPGMDGQLVLEFYNAGPIPLALSPGLAIGAVSFEKLQYAVEKPYYARENSKYIGQDGAVPSRQALDQPISL